MNNQNLRVNEKSASEISRELAIFGFIPVAKDYPVAKLYNLIFLRAEDLGASESSIYKFWSEYNKLTIPMFRVRSPRDVVSIIKKKFLKADKTGSGVHMFLALLGSKSSKRVIRQGKLNSRELD